MGESIHDVMTSNRLVVTVTNRDSVLRVVANGRMEEERQLVGILAQTDVAKEGKDAQTGQLVQEISEQEEVPSR